MSERNALYVESEKGQWFRYTDKSDIDQILEALDERGIRERALKYLTWFFFSFFMNLRFALAS